MILDGEQRAALAAARSLVRAGLAVGVGYSSSGAIAAATGGIAYSAKLPSPAVSVSRFKADLDLTAARKCTPWVLPITDSSASALLSLPSDHLNFATPLDSAGYNRLSDKTSLVELARRHDVPTPNGKAVTSVSAALEAAQYQGFPVVLKPARSKVLIEDCVVATSVRVAHTPNDIEAYLTGVSWFPTVSVIVQQFIPGHGAGVFCLYDRDHAIAWFAHRRIREKPPSGGVSVLCESVSVVPVLKDYAERLLRAAEYRGVAMVEFRIGTDGRPYLMEVNARFWGSLQLAIDCGVDFPWLYYQMLMGEAVAPMQDYEVGRRLRWWLGDLDHVLLQIRNPALGIGAKLAVVGRFLGTSFDPHCRNEVFRRSDPGPGLLELRQWVAGVLGRAP